MSGRPPRMTPDRRVGGMSEAEKGTGKLHMLHEGEIVLNRATTNMLLKKLGISKDTAMKMAAAPLMKRVKDVLSAVGDVKKAVAPVPKRQKGGMAAAAPAAASKRPERYAPKRMKGGMARPARKAPARMKGGMAASDERAERDKRLGRRPQYDTL